MFWNVHDRIILSHIVTKSLDGFADRAHKRLKDEMQTPKKQVQVISQPRLRLKNKQTLFHILSQNSQAHLFTHLLTQQHTEEGLRVNPKNIRLRQKRDQIKKLIQQWVHSK